eukprot:TRINITY_DN1448_c0_g1_i2.p1 TRINITY_DN1448_c0_g1~~TRINITY_DN1448_c0_g1_i2.p1  ORF type:complete len:1094 (+),score=187.95 TRINITY_DN1448_c0_g1_i2:37-3318(+)
MFQKKNQKQKQKKSFEKIKLNNLVIKMNQETFLASEDTMEANKDVLIQATYYLSSYLFILALGGLSHQVTSKRGNYYGMLGMLLAITLTCFVKNFYSYDYLKFGIALTIGACIGLTLAARVEMIAMPQMVALLHTFVGLAATVVAWANYIKKFGINGQTKPEELRAANKIETWIGMWIGAITFTGSIVAALKLNENISSAPLILYKGNFRHWLNLVIMIIVIVLCPIFVYKPYFIILAANCGLSLFLGWHLIMAIGGADMPVVISMLNSYSGWATSFSGFMLGNELLIISGALIGSSGAILSYIMCRGMNRSIVAVIAGGFGLEISTQQNISGQLKPVTTPDVVDALLKAKSVMCVPGYGMAVARAQNAVGALAQTLRKMGKSFKFCIHPVAGRLPGHMNVLLAEANVPYDIVHEMEKVNEDFANTDITLVIGANDIVNMDACDNPNSPIAGMPICKTWESKRVFIIKRGAGKGYAGIENPLFFKENSNMYYGSADVKAQELVNEIAKHAGTAAVAVAKEEKKVEVQEEDDNEDLTEYLAKCVKEIGIPKEVSNLEKRVSFVPKEVRKLVKLGFKVKVEEGAGKDAGFEDEEYIRNGGQIVSTEEVWNNTEIIVKVRGPEYNENLGMHEADTLQKTNLLISYIFPAFNPDLVSKLMKDKPNLTVFSLDCQPRTLSRAQKIDTITSTTNITGYKAVLEAFYHLPRSSKAVMSAAGNIQPATVFVLGCGIAGLAAITLAKSMGALVKAFDSRAEVKQQIESLGATFIELDYKEEGSGAGGYGKVMSQGYYKAQHQMVADICKTADIVITTALIPGRKAPILVNEAAVRNMKPGSVIVDMAAEMGGNCELTRKGELYVDPVSGVQVLGFYDLASRMATQASEVFSVNMWHLFNELCGTVQNKGNNAKNFQIDINDEIVTALAIIHKGEYRYKPPGQAPPPQKPQENKKQEQKPVEVKEIKQNEKKQDDQESSPFMSAFTIFVIGIVCALFTGYFWETLLISQTGIFILAIFTGYLVIWNVTPSLHTPLMSETNAISGVIVVGAMVAMGERKKDRVGKYEGQFDDYSIVAWTALAFSSINIFGGFLVTYRMLEMFKK